MPLVRIALRQGRPGLGKKIGEIIYKKMQETLNVPPNDNFQIITEHGADGLIYDSSYLNIQRTDGIVIIQITLNEGRSLELKKENWSFGNGIAQYAS